MTQVKLYTDGACSGNPGPGGWGCVLIASEATRKISGYDPATTNNRMELMAVISGLKALKKSTSVEVFTDSMYVKNAFTEGWLAGWQRNGWKTSQGKAVKNQDLWLELSHLQRVHQLKWTWVKGHSGDHYNEICDTLARLAITQKGGDDEKIILEKGLALQG